jgi:hypothetical protein
MLQEIAIFFIPWLVLTIGFSVALIGVFRVVGVDELSYFPTTLFFLFRSFSDRMDFTVLDRLSDNPLLNNDALASYRIYGYFLLISYTILCTILMGNLLIAIITNRYRPEAARSQSALQFAQTVDQHAFQVSHDLLCSPFNVIVFLFSWIPRGTRRKVMPILFIQRGILPLDGWAPATPKHPTLPTGSAEISHLLYLICFRPFLFTALVFLFALQAPFCILYFAATGHKKMTRQVQAAFNASFSWSSSSSSGGEEEVFASKVGLHALSS